MTAKGGSGHNSPGEGNRHLRSSLSNGQPWPPRPVIAYDRAGEIERAGKGVSARRSTGEFQLQHLHRLPNAVLFAIALSIGLALASAAHAEEDYGPEHAAAAFDQLPLLRCRIGINCPISGEAYTALSGALAGDRDAQYQFARLLQRGDGVLRDARAATGWYGKAAEQSHVAAALELNHLRHQGAEISGDEVKIAAALGLAVDKGDIDAMRALADMRIYGRGGARDSERGLGLLRRATKAGSAAAAQDLGNLFVRGAPGIPENPAEGFRWMAESGRLGNVAAMLSLGSMYFNHPDGALHDPAEGYAWLMRAALVDDPAAQEMLSGVLADGAMAGARTVIAPDPVAADMWLRLAARSQFHDNASLRLRVEANMTAAQRDEAKKRADEWHPHTLPEVLAMTITPPPVTAANRPWPQGLRGRALESFKEAGDNPPPWQRLPDFARGEEVMTAITAIATYCDGKGQKRCVDTCRQQLDYVAPPVKVGGLSAAELARYLHDHPDSSPVRAMRKEPATAEQAMHSWVLCANGVAGEL
jgi:TPR repeat protein